MATASAAQRTFAEAAMSAVLLALTPLDAHSHSHLEKAAALAAGTGMQLRLAYCGTGHNVFDSPLARLEQRARHLARQFELVVEAVEEAMTSLEVLRFHANRSTLLCLASAPPVEHAQPPGADWLARALRLHTAPVLVMHTTSPATYRKVLVPVSLKADSSHLLRWATALGGRARIDVFHVADLPEVASRAREHAGPIVLEHFLRKACVDAHQQMALLSSGLSSPRAALQYAMVHGPVRERILAQQQSHGHDLVVVGSRPRRCWSWPLWRDPLAVTLANELQADVLIVPKARPRKAWMPAQRWGPAA
jgi:nucleotide-binding universal stress UspA family protein